MTLLAHNDVTDNGRDGVSNHQPHGNSPVTGEFPAQRPVTRSFDVFFDRAWINSWVNNCEAGDLRRAHYDVSVMGCRRLNVLSRFAPPNDLCFLSPTPYPQPNTPTPTPTPFPTHPYPHLTPPKKSFYTFKIIFAFKTLLKKNEKNWSGTGKRKWSYDIIWPNGGILSIRPLGTNFSEIFNQFSFKNIHLKISSGKWRPSCLDHIISGKYCTVLYAIRLL